MAKPQEDIIEQTLFQAREVQAYKIPPRPSAGGHKSGEWKVADRIFGGRLRVVSIGEMCELRLEDPSSGELFAMCPVPLGQRSVAVEPAADSSRYFVLRLVDATTKRHAFIGMGFTDRAEAFDFNVALSDHEKYIQRAREVQEVRSQDAPAASTDAGKLYQKQDLRLKEGETIKINMRRASGDTATPSGGFLSNLAPPKPTSQPARLMARLIPIAPPTAAPSTQQGHLQERSGAAFPSSGGDVDFLGFGSTAADARAAQGSQQPPSTQSGWATFE